MSTMTSKIKLGIIYTDYSDRTYNINNNNAAANEVKEKIAAFNTAAADPNSSVAKTFISEGGAPVARISEADMIYTQEDVIYRG